VVDGVPLFRHHLVNNEWMIHASSRQFMEENEHLMEESRALREAFDEQTLPMIKPAIDEITRRLGLEYYGIDCNTDDQGNILIFEVNANMNILFNTTKSMENQLDRIKEHIRELIKNYATT